MATEIYGLEGLRFTKRKEEEVPKPNSDRRRVDKDQKKTPEIQNLWQRHHEIINLAVRGFKQQEIAEILNIHPTTVSNTLNSQLGNEKLAEIRGERDEDVKLTMEKVRYLTNRAIATYQEILDNESKEATLKDRKDVANTVLLELSGLRVPTKVHSMSTTLTLEELEEFKKRGIEEARESGLLVETTAEEVKEEKVEVLQD